MRWSFQKKPKLFWIFIVGLMTLPVLAIAEGAKAVSELDLLNLILDPKTGVITVLAIVVFALYRVALKLYAQMQEDRQENMAVWKQLQTILGTMERVANHLDRLERLERNRE